MRNVLREQLPYYCYDTMCDVRQAVVDSLREAKNHPRVISFKGMKMLFRITNHFNPQSIMQVGSCYGMASLSMLNVSSTSRLWLYDSHLDAYQVTGKVLSPYFERIECYNILDVALDDYAKSISAGDNPFVLVNSIPENEDVETLERCLLPLLQKDSVIVIRDINRDDSIKALWQHLNGAMSVGQSFTNEKTGVIVAKRSLNLEQFFLWF